MEKRIVTRDKRGDVIRIVEYYEPHVAKDRRLKRKLRELGLAMIVGIVLGGVLLSLYSDVRLGFCRSTYSRF